MADEFGRLVFAQLLDFLPRHEFNRCVRRYRGNFHSRSLSCYDQFLCLAFAQLTGCESLRQIEICLEAMGPKLYHAGWRSSPARSTLADANERRDWRIYADFAQELVVRARKLYAGNPRRGVGRDRLCARFDDRRSVPFAFSLGKFPSRQGRGQTPHPDGPSRQYPCIFG